jgi:peptidoglycan-associated lipoprotein
MNSMMVKRLAAILILTAVSACSSDVLVRDAKDVLTPADVAESMARQRADAAAQQARMLREQADLKRQLNERNRRETASATPGPQVNRWGEQSIEGNALRDPAGRLNVSEDLLGQRTVYYDYDSYAVKQDYQPMLEAHAALLSNHPEMQIAIEGNCDERGSREYNLALGQRRADAVKRALILLGVSPAQIKTVSYGSEKPRAEGSSEDQLAQNRRSDMVYPGIAAEAVTTR